MDRDGMQLRASQTWALSAALAAANLASCSLFCFAVSKSQRNVSSRIFNRETSVQRCSKSLHCEYLCTGTQRPLQAF